jgi:hypothetical protein
VREEKWALHTEHVDTADRVLVAFIKYPVLISAGITTVLSEVFRNILQLIKKYHNNKFELYSSIFFPIIINSQYLLSHLPVTVAERSLGCRDHRFESYSRHGCLYVCAFFCVCVVLCGRGLAMG